MRLIRDDSEFIRASLAAIEEHLILGGFLAAIIVFIFLRNFRSTLIAAVAIPASIIGAFGVMSALNFTINQMTMLALTLMVGIVIDDAIVVLEPVRRGERHDAAARGGRGHQGNRPRGHGDDDVAAGGVPAGRLPRRDHRAVHVVVRPDVGGGDCHQPDRLVHARRCWRRAGSSTTTTNARATTRGAASTATSIAPHADAGILDGSPLGDRRRVRDGHRLAGAAVRASGINFTPQEDESRFQVSVRLPVGSSLAATTSLMERIARDMREQLPGRLRHAVLPRRRRRRLRTDQRGKPVRPAQADRRARVLAAGADRRARRLIQPYRQSAVISIQAAGGLVALSGRGAQINARWSGRMQKLDQYTERARQLLSKNDALVDVDRTYLPGRPELRLNIDRKRAGDLGVRVQDVSQTVNALVAGQKVTTFNAASDQYDVVLRAQDSFRRTPGRSRPRRSAPAPASWCSCATS